MITARRDMAFSGLQTDSRPDRATAGVFALIVLIGGTNFVAVSVNVEELDPFWAAGLRFSGSAALLLSFMAIRRRPLPRGSDLGAAVAFGVLNFAILYAAVYWSMQYLSAGVVSIIISVSPLATVILASSQSLERFRLRSLLGSIVAVGGIVVMRSGSSESDFHLAALLVLGLAIVGVAEAKVIAKRYAGAGPVSTTAVAMATGALLLLGASGLAGEEWSAPTRLATSLSLVYLIVASPALFVGMLFIIDRWTASGASFATVLFPLVTVTLDALLGREVVTATAMAGGALVIGGVAAGVLVPDRWLGRYWVNRDATRE